MMHVSWTTLQEQIFAKLRRPYRSEADMNEVGHGIPRLIFKLAATFGLSRWRFERRLVILFLNCWR
jgi:hypothetical protein